MGIFALEFSWFQSAIWKVVQIFIHPIENDKIMIDRVKNVEQSRVDCIDNDDDDDNFLIVYKHSRNVMWVCEYTSARAIVWPGHNELSVKCRGKMTRKMWTARALNFSLTEN